MLLQVREYLEKNYEELEGDDAVKLALRALLEVVESGSKNIEVALMKKEGLKILDDQTVDQLVSEIEAEKGGSA